jgi:hypothetical protein
VAAPFETSFSSCGTCVVQSGSRAEFLPVIPVTAPHSSIISGWYSRPNSWLVYQGDSVSPHPKREEKVLFIVLHYVYIMSDVTEMILD